MLEHEVRVLLHLSVVNPILKPFNFENSLFCCNGRHTNSDNFTFQFKEGCRSKEDSRSWGKKIRTMSPFPIYSERLQSIAQQLFCHSRSRIVHGFYWKFNSKLLPSFSLRSFLYCSVSHHHRRHLSLLRSSSRLLDLYSIQFPARFEYITDGFDSVNIYKRRVEQDTRNTHIERESKAKPIWTLSDTTEMM